MNGEVFIGKGYHDGITGVGLEDGLEVSLNAQGFISGKELTKEQVDRLLELRGNGTKLTNV